MQCVKARLKDAQRVKRELISRDLIDLRFNSDKDDGFIYFPIKKKVSGYDLVERDLQERKVHKDLKGTLSGVLSQEELDSLRKSMDIIGSIAIIEIPEELSSKDKLIAQHVLSKNIKTVLRKGKHEGEFRTQKLKFLAGVDTRETVHKENGVSLKIDVEQVYFSPRLSSERMRIAKLVKKGEEVLVVGSGGGAYTCVIGKNSPSTKIVGVEINPEGHKCALASVKLNKLKNVEHICGDAAQVLPKLGKFDRIALPMPHNAADFLELAMDHAKKGATIHFYDFELESEVEKGVEKIKRTGRKFKLIDTVKTGTPSPRKFRYCYDFRLVL